MPNEKTARARARRAPNDEAARALTRRAFELHVRGDLDAAIDAYRAALRETPRFAATWYALGCAELAREAFTTAARCFRRSLVLRPDWPTAELDLGRALFGLGEVDRAIARVRSAARTTNPELRRRALGYLAIIVPGGARENNRSVLAARTTWARLLAKKCKGMVRPKRAPSRSRAKLRVGYVSAYFGYANWMKPVWGVVNHHDRRAFEIHLFSDRARPSKESGYRPNSLDEIHDVTGLSNEAVARRIADTNLDVLVDLNAYSFPERFGVFVRRPAPVQIAWFNAYATTGIAAFDLVIGDAAVIPKAEEDFYTEQVLRVPGSYLAFSVPYRCPPVTPPPSVAQRHLTFGSFCSQYKLTDDVVAAWSKILERAPTSRLFVKNRALGEPSNRAAFLRRLSRRGIDPSRITVEGPAAHAEFLRAYARVDVALDVFPYSGGTTTMEALWQGVPVLTCDGDRWASRTSRSLVLAAGLDAWDTPNPAKYVEHAVTIANDRSTPGMLSALRRSMRARLRRSPACDSAGLARALEALYRETVDGERNLRSRRRAR